MRRCGGRLESFGNWTYDPDAFTLTHRDGRVMRLADVKRCGDVVLELACLAEVGLRYSAKDIGQAFVALDVVFNFFEATDYGRKLDPALIRRRGS